MDRCIDCLLYTSSGLQDCYADLRTNVKNAYGIEIETLAAIGVSSMMHGYMPFNKKEESLVPFRTWRNTNTCLLDTSELPSAISLQTILKPSKS